MHRRYGLLILLTAIIALSSAYFGFMAFNASGLPLGVQVVDARTGIIVPVPGLALPQGLHAGERIDMAAQPPATRIAIAQLNPNGQPLPSGEVYGFVIRRGTTAVTVSVTSIRERGDPNLPRSVATDDLALVKLRAHDSEVDLHEAPSGLGRDGYAFPLRARGHLIGVLVVGPRPGEHYAAEERELMAHVAHAVGASLLALRAQVTEGQLSAARAEIEVSAARLDQARAQAQASEALLNDARMRESTLLEALRALGAAPRA